MDKLKHDVFYRLWVIWHMRWRRFFDRFAPACSGCQDDGYHCYHAKYVITSRPWWHLCCNGDSGGWRTRVCDWLENQWRSTDYYNKHG